MTQQLLTPHQSQYYAWLLTLRRIGKRNMPANGEV